MAGPHALIEPLLALHERIRDSVREACARAEAEEMAAVAGEEGGDTIYAVDRVGEEVLVSGLEEIAREEPLVLLAEGLPGGAVTLPEGTPEEACVWRVLVDPIDGTRGLMYQKRSAWILTGVAPNRGAETRLRDVVLAVQTEIPLLKQHLADQLWAVRGEGVRAR
ncbi:MAG: inositol monophosphatase, partial [Gemmatimonadota bacterium]|nr:inositol monophosphatase [Gemmatimonadota bacterium]